MTFLVHVKNTGYLSRLYGPPLPLKKGQVFYIQNGLPYTCIHLHDVTHLLFILTEANSERGPYVSKGRVHIFGAVLLLFFYGKINRLASIVDS